MCPTGPSCSPSWIPGHGGARVSRTKTRSRHPHRAGERDRPPLEFPRLRLSRAAHQLPGESGLLPWKRARNLARALGKFLLGCDLLSPTFAVLPPGPSPIVPRRTQGQAPSPPVSLALTPRGSGERFPSRRLRYFSGWKTVAAEAREVGDRSPKYGLHMPRAQCGALVRLGCARGLLGKAAKCPWWLRTAGT